VPSYALKQHERECILAVANEPRFADVPPARIVPILADEGIYLASESSFAPMLTAARNSSAGTVIAQPFARLFGECR